MQPQGVMGLLEGDQALLEQASAWNPRTLRFSDLTVETLKRLGDEHGIELATAILYDRLRGSEQHGQFIRRVEAQLACPAESPLLDAHVGVVPGAMWQHYPHTGADGEWIIRILRELGMSAQRIAVPGFGTLDENAGVLLNWLNAHLDRPVVLVSLSKGGPDVKRALGVAPGSFDRVRAWVSVGGSMQGSPLVRWLDDRPMRKLGLRLLLRLRGEGLHGIDDLRRDPGAPLWNWPALPNHLRLTHVMSFPLRRHCTHKWAGRGYQRAAPMGPNDGGGILLGDVTTWPGHVYPIWGADHYLQPIWDATPLLRAIFTEALRDRPAHRSAASPSATPDGRSTK